MQEPEIMNRKEKLKFAFRTFRGRRHEGKSVTERFKSEYPFLADIMEEMLVEAQAFLKMNDDEFELKFISSMPYGAFKTLISYYAEEELKKTEYRKRKREKTDSHFLHSSSVTLQ